MRPTPASKIDKTVQRLNEIGNYFDVTNFRFELNGFKLDAKKIIKTDPEWGYSILGIIACIENNLIDMHKFHKKAIDASGGGLISYIQYANSFAHIDDNQKAFELALEAQKVAPADVGVLKILLSLSYYINDLISYKKYKRKLDKLNVPYQDPNDFDEDNDVILSRIISDSDDLLESKPELIEKPDPDLLIEIKNLIEGVDIS